MFTQLIESARLQEKNKKSLSFTLALLLHLLVVGLLLIFPLLFPQTMATTFSFVAALMPLSPPPGPSNQTQLAGGRSHFTPRTDLTWTAPDKIPAGVRNLVDQLGHTPGLGPERGFIENGVPGGESCSVWSRWLAEPGPVVPPPPVKPEPVRQELLPAHIKVGGDIQLANLISKETPPYPILAKQSNIQGIVVLSAVIGVDGTIEELKVISGHPLLVRAAMESIKNWRYRPTLLNGNPVKVETTIKVVFNLGKV
jgi:periplasmic protein TonB